MLNKSVEGIHARARYVSTYPLKGGKPCNGSLKEIKSCNVKECDVAPTTPSPPVDCVLGDWSSWTSCSVSCGSGEQTRSRIVLTQPKWGGKICDGDLKEIRGCNTQICMREDEHKTVKDCAWSSWDSWGACSVTCGGGQKVTIGVSVSRSSGRYLSTINFIKSEKLGRNLFRSLPGSATKEMRASCPPRAHSEAGLS